MANIKSQKKRIKTNEKSRVRNVAVRTRMKTYLKKVDEAIEQQNAEQIAAAVKQALTEIDVAARKGVIHKNTAARKKSRLQRRATAAAK